MQILPLSRTAPKISIAALSILLLSLPSLASAQSRGPQGPQASGGHPMAGEPKMSRHAERMMRLYDINGDKNMTAAEINDDQSRIFTAIDIDGDKSLSVDEMKRRGRSLQIFRTTTLFDLLDTDGNGKLSVAEIQAPSKRWFKRYDANGDGKMDASEIPGRHKYRGRSRSRPR